MNFICFHFPSSISLILLEPLSLKNGGSNPWNVHYTDFLINLCTDWALMTYYQNCSDNPQSLTMVIKVIRGDKSLNLGIMIIAELHM